jgi:hypothetical protein
MALIDVCNGDADGLFAILQLRLAEPAQAQLITGRKHEIALLERIEPRAGDRLTVCDISIDRNADALARHLATSVSVRYFDHHSARRLFAHPALETFIDHNPALCTSLIVNRYLGSRFAAWAAAAAWGDNLPSSAEALADELGLDSEARAALRTLGESVNYNAYGERDEDCLIAPAALYPLLARHADPFDAIATEPVLAELAQRRQSDLALAQAQAPWLSDAQVRVWLLSDAPWSRRALGPFANQVALEDPNRAHAVARLRGADQIDVSVRAPLLRRSGADRLCARFGGGGRAAAAAIEALPAARFEEFVQAFRAVSWGESAA